MLYKGRELFTRLHWAFSAVIIYAVKGVEMSWRFHSPADGMSVIIMSLCIPAYTAG